MDVRRPRRDFPMRRVLVVPLALCFLIVPILKGAPISDASENTYQDDAGYQNFSPDQIDNLVSPIALYPDPLLAQVFVAATFPDQVEEASRYVRGNGANGIDEQNWDVSVRSVAHYPTVIGMMADKIDWTTSLGQAYVNQSTDVAASVQRLRHMARNAGNLASTPQQEVLVHDDYIAISPYQPQYIYVPVYDPAICYYRRPYYGPAITFGAGFPIGAWLNLDFRWGYGGGWGGVYYTGWRPGGWGGGCWNCGWIGRSRSRVTVVNNVYVNNRYSNITVNRTVVNRTVDVTNINRYNYIHKNVTYNNVQVNNTRINNRAGNGGGYNNRPGGRPGNDVRPIVNNPGVNNKIIDRNIDRNNPRIDQNRGRDNNVRNDRPPNQQEHTLPAQQQQQRRAPQQPQRPTPQQQRPQQNLPQSRPAPQPGPHTFGRNEGNFDPRTTSQRGQASRQQQPAPPKAAPSRPTPQAQNHPAPPQGGGQRRKP
jgi:hypothetical protein